MWPQFNVKRPARRRMLTGAFLCLPFTNAPGKQPQAPAAIVLNALCYASYLSASTQLLCIISAFITLYPIPSTIISARSTSAVNPLTVVVTIKKPSLTARSSGTRSRIHQPDGYVSPPKETAGDNQTGLRSSFLVFDFHADFASR